MTRLAITITAITCCGTAACVAELGDDDAATQADEVGAATSALTARPCSAAKLAELVAPATAAAPLARVDCSVTLSATTVVTKRLLFEGPVASGQTLDCAGGLINGAAGTVNAGGRMLEIRSRKLVDPVTGAASWQRPEGVTIRNCRITGSTRIWGMATNGQGVDLRDSSRLPGHVDRARANAPRDIRLEHLTITATGPNPLYLSPGVSGVVLRDSEITGDVADGLAIYLDTESTGNTLRNNTIHPRNGVFGRELIALDGSSNNTIVNNHFSSLSNGGIFLYRNCGEGGTIRISTPSNNAIVNNTFFYAHYTGNNPSVWLGSRDGNPFPFLVPYCDDDAGFPFGSSGSDLDFAQNNGVLQNQIFVRSVADMIQTRHFAINSPNVIAANQTVTAAVARRAGCFLPAGYGQKLLLDGQATEILLGADGKPACDGKRYTCHDGALTATPVVGQACAFTPVAFDCAANGTNSGCQKAVACPAGKAIVGGYGACNLESSSLAAPGPSNRLTVVTPSDVTGDGHCMLDGHDLAQGREFVTGIAGKPSVVVGCRELDLLGGDCRITGAIYCR